MASDKKNALVTGAARGIGLATVKRLLAEGWSVSMLDRDEVELGVAAEGLGAVEEIVADVSDPDQVARSLKERTNLRSLARSAASRMGESQLPHSSIAQFRAGVPCGAL